jgi:ABC-2 type transport system ATP-binding protein
LLSVAGIVVAYGARRALDGVDLAIAEGERVGLLGPNGAGKTTLLRVIAGYLEPDAGSLEIDGVDGIADPAAIGRRVGYLPEGAPAYSEMRAVDYLVFRARLKGMSRSEAREAAAAVLERVALADRASSRIATLSGGMRKRLGLAEALLRDPPLLILDEPTTGLDPAQLRRLIDRVSELAADRALLLSSHRLESVTALCDRLAVMRAGKVVYDGPAADLGGDLEGAFLALTSEDEEEEEE